MNAFVAFAAAIGITTPQQVTYKEIELYLAWLRQEKKLSAQSANRHLATLRAFWRFLVRDGLAAGNVAADVYSLKSSRRLPNYLTIAEQERLLERLIRDHSPCGQRDLAIVSIMLFVGLRVSETVALRLADVDLEIGTVRVHESKGLKSRELPLVPRLRGILRAYLSDGRPRLTAKHPSPFFIVNAHRSQAFVTRADGQILTRSVFAMMRRTVSPIVGRPVHPHALRHSFASRLREKGADLALIQEALGHANISTTMCYAHLSTSRRRDELARLLG